MLTRDPRGYHTLELLDAFTPGDARERSDHARMLELLATTPHPFAREQFAPGHFTASALVISPDAAQVLLIHHPTLSLWLQPGGHIEPGDATLVDAARREVQEETGLMAADMGAGLRRHDEGPPSPRHDAGPALEPSPRQNAGPALELSPRRRPGPIFDIDIHQIPARGTAPAHLHFDLRFLAVVHGLPAPASQEGVEARWLTPAAAAALTTDESVRRMIRRAFGTA